MTFLTVNYPRTTRGISDEVSPRPIRLFMKVISMGLHVTGTDAWSRRKRTQGADNAHHMKEARANEAVDSDYLSKAPNFPRASNTTRFTHRHCSEHEVGSPMPVFESDITMQLLPLRPEANLGDPDKTSAAADDITEVTYLPVEKLAHASNYRIQEASTNEHVSSTASWKNFQTRVHNLPPELCKTIMDMLCEDAFGPGEVHPQTDAPVTNMFLALDKQLYHRYSHIYWSRNTWVVGIGPANDSMRFMTMPPYNTSTTEFSRQIPNKAAFTIRRIELRFSKEDLPPRSHQRLFSPSAIGAAPQSIHSFDMFDEYKSACKVLASELKEIWRDKFDRVAFLELDHFTLDVTQAYAPDGEFLGIDAVQRLLPFVHGMPADVKVLAPSKVLEREVRKVVEAVNDAA